MKLRNIIYIGLASLALNSCDFLDEYSQDQAYISKWQDLNELLIGDCYIPCNSTANFHSYSNLGMFLHLLADEMDERNGSANGSSLWDEKYQTFAYHTWQHRTGLKETYAGDYYLENIAWTRLYRSINIANNILKSSEELPMNTQEEIAGYNKVRGEAHFLRAFYYFWLTNVYGQPYDPKTADEKLGVPLKTSEEVLDIKYQRNTVQECYERIVADLVEAEKELTAYGLSQPSIYRADSVAAQLLLARTYLYMQNWDMAEKYVRKVVKNHPDLQNINTNKDRHMKKTNPENIFSMGGDDLPGFLTDQYQAYQVHKEHYSIYTDNDLRQKNWYYTYNTYTGLSKRPEHSQYAETYKQTDKEYTYFCYYGLCGLLSAGERSDVSSLFWLRSSEAYFILAEALAYQGKTEEALEVLNTQRAARYYPNSAELSKTYTEEELVNEIRLERRKEFAFEGHRWFDLRRYRVCEKYPSKISITHTHTYYIDRGEEEMIETHIFKLNEEDASWTVPIPTEVLEFNTGMEGNGNVFREYEVVAPIYK